MKKILVINPGSTSTKIAFYHDGEQVWKESIEHDAAEIKKYAVIYDQKDMRTKLVRDALAAHGEKVTELEADNSPVPLFCSIAEFSRIPFHHSLYGKRMLNMEGIFVVFF